jgi:hypothetical protein
MPDIQRASSLTWLAVPPPQIGVDYVSCSPYRVPVARFAASQAAILTKRESNGGLDTRSKILHPLSG